jgi:hypothetical protein
MVGMEAEQASKQTSTVLYLLLFACLVYSSTLKKEAARISK